jgi:hypothetical protein
MKKVIMLASTLKCSVIVKEAASNRSLVSFLRKEKLIGDCQIYSVDVKLDGEKAIEIAFSDQVFDQAETIKGDHTQVIVPAEFVDRFREIVP